MCFVKVYIRDKKIIYLLFFFIFLFNSCVSDKEIHREYNHLEDGTVQKEIIQYKSGGKTEIFFQVDLNHGTYQKFDKNGKVRERGKYINGLFQKEYSENDVGRDSLIGLLAFFFVVWSIYKINNNYQGMLDWYRKMRK